MSRLIPLRFTPEDADRAHAEWGCNCGPGAIAAICGLSLDELRPHLGDFEAKRYTNPTLMWAILRSLGVDFSYRGGDLGRGSWPAYGLARIQWEGPWTAPGVPMRARYRYTHWVGVCTAAPGKPRGAAGGTPDIGIWDINALANRTGWCALADWEQGIVPHILEACVPRASGDWHITHSVEVNAGSRS